MRKAVGKTLRFFIEAFVYIAQFRFCIDILYFLCYYIFNI